MIRVDACKVARTNSEGPMSQPVRDVNQRALKGEIWGRNNVPTRQPVAAKDFPALPTVNVRSHMPGRAAIRTCSVPSKVRQSY